MDLFKRTYNRCIQRQPDFVVGADDPKGAYLWRWFVIPRNKVFNIYLHLFLRSDEDFALHDHPWLFNFSRIWRGQYNECTIAAGGVNVATTRAAGDWKFRWGRAPHRVDLTDGPCWTFFFTGPVVREWGFHCPKGWVAFKDKITYTEKGSTGRKACP